MNKHYFGTAPAPRVESGQAGSRFSRDQIVSFSAPFILDAFLSEPPRSVTAKSIKDAVPEFEVYSVANAIGDALGPNNATGARLHHSPGKNPRQYPSCFENASRIFDFMTDESVGMFAESRGVSVSDIEQQIEGLPRLLA